jgi:hypothetical protein
MVTARHQDPIQRAQTYQGRCDPILSIDGIQQEKDHMTLYAVREFRRRRVRFANPLARAAAVLRQAKTLRALRKKVLSLRKIVLPYGPSGTRIKPIVGSGVYDASCRGGALMRL